MHLHRYTITRAGQKITILAVNDWHAIDQAMLIFGHIGGVVPKREAP